MLTLQQLKDMPPGIFAYGTCINSPEDVYMTDSNIGKELMWVAVRGGIWDWAIYIYWAEDNSIGYIADYGDKVRNVDYIKRFVPCDEEAFKMYRLR